VIEQCRLQEHASIGTVGLNPRNSVSGYDAAFDADDVLVSSAYSVDAVIRGFSSMGSTMLSPLLSRKKV
jgi:hypothetical protein